MSDTSDASRSRNRTQKVISLPVAGLLSLGTVCPAEFLNAENKQKATEGVHLLLADLFAPLFHILLLLWHWKAKVVSEYSSIFLLVLE